MQIEEDEEMEENVNTLTGKKKEINKLKRQAAALELVNNIEENVKKTDLFSIIYDSKERVSNVDCSRFHPKLEKTYDIKNLFVTGMDGDALQEEHEK